MWIMLLHYYHNIFKYTKWADLPFFVIARILLVDSESFPSDPDMVDSLTEAISNFFSVACNLGGPSRMSLFGIMTFSSYPEVIIKKNADTWQCDIKLYLSAGISIIIYFFFTKMGDWTAIVCIVAPSTYNCSQPGGADLRSIRVILFNECSDSIVYTFYIFLSYWPTTFR